MTIYRNYLLNKRNGFYQVYRVNLVDNQLKRLGKNMLCRDRARAKKWVNAHIKMRLIRPIL